MAADVTCTSARYVEYHLIKKKKNRQIFFSENITSTYLHGLRQTYFLPTDSFRDPF